MRPQAAVEAACRRADERAAMRLRLRVIDGDLPDDAEATPRDVQKLLVIARCAQFKEAQR